MTPDELLVLIDRAMAQGWRELDLSGQELTELPVEIGKLKQLESLILGKKVEVYEYVGERYLEKVSGNNLKTLPLELLGLPNLRKLDISANPLESIFDVITQILHLEELILIRVELTQIPDAIAKLTNLTLLHLSDNKISQISEALASKPIPKTKKSSSPLAAAKKPAAYFSASSAMSSKKSTKVFPISKSLNGFPSPNIPIISPLTTKNFSDLRQWVKAQSPSVN